MAVSISDSDSWIRSYGRAPGKVRLFCFPHAGGAASYFHPWAASLAPGIEVLAVQYPGRQDRHGEPCVQNIPDLADRVHEALRSWPPGPFAFFGHSMGAVLAFEVACRIAREGGGGPAHLFVSGRRAPSRHRHEELHRASTPALIAELRSLGGTDPRVLDDPELLNMALPTVRADYTAIETYRFGSAPPLSCAITALLGDQDPKTDIGEATAWSEHTTGEFDLRVYPGGHFYLNDCRPGVLDLLSSSLS
jgi:surfactin synthase thioesterase subunit